MKRAWCVPLLAWIAGCANDPDARLPTRTAAAPAPAPAKPWAHLKEVEAWAPLNTVPFLSRGHLTTPNYASVRVSPNARNAYATLVADTKLPDAALIALFHQNRDGSQRGAIFVMEKHGESWRFFALDQRGAPMTVATEACARCHASGVADSVFGLPRARPAAPAE